MGCIQDGTAYGHEMYRMFSMLIMVGSLAVRHAIGFHAQAQFLFFKPSSATTVL